MTEIYIKFFISILKNASLSISNFIVNLLFLKFYLEQVGTINLELFLVSVSLASILTLPLNTFPLAYQKSLLSEGQPLSLSKHFFQLSMIISLIYFAGAIYKNLYITAIIVPITLCITNYLVLTIDYFDRQIVKFYSSAVSMVVFIIVLKYDASFALILYLVFRNLILYFGTPKFRLKKFDIKILSWDQLLFSAAQTSAEHVIKLILPIIATSGAIVTFETICRTMYTLRGFLGQMIQPIIFRIFKNEMKEDFEIFYVFNFLSIFVYVIMLNLLNRFFDLTMSGYTMALIIFAFSINQAVALKYASIIATEGYKFLTLSTISILACTIAFILLDYDVVASYALGILFHTVINILYGSLRNVW